MAKTQQLTEEIHLLLQATIFPNRTYYLKEIDGKDTKVTLFNLMDPANSNSHAN